MLIFWNSTWIILFYQCVVRPFFGNFQWGTFNALSLGILLVAIVTFWVLYLLILSNKNSAPWSTNPASDMLLGINDVVMLYPAVNQAKNLISCWKRGLDGTTYKTVAVIPYFWVDITSSSNVPLIFILIFGVWVVSFFYCFVHRFDDTSDVNDDFTKAPSGIIVTLVTKGAKLLVGKIHGAKVGPHFYNQYLRHPGVTITTIASGLYVANSLIDGGTFVAKSVQKLIIATGNATPINVGPIFEDELKITGDQLENRRRSVVSHHVITNDFLSSKAGATIDSSTPRVSSR